MLALSFFLKMGVMVAFFEYDGKFELNKIIEVIVNKIGSNI